MSTPTFCFYSFNEIYFLIFIYVIPHHYQCYCHCHHHPIFFTSLLSASPPASFTAIVITTNNIMIPYHHHNQVIVIIIVIKALILYPFFFNVFVGVFSPHTQLIVLFGEPSPQGFVLIPECESSGFSPQAKGFTL